MHGLKFLVTGSAGLIGSHVAGLLEARGDTVVGFDISPRDHHHGLDLRNREHLRAALRGCDGVIHLAAVSRVVTAEENPALCEAVNIGGTRNICEEVAELSPRPFVIFASSREVYGHADRLPVSESARLQPCNVYGRSKLAGEQLMSRLAGAGTNVLVLRFSNVYGSTGDHADRVIPAFARRAAGGGRITVNGTGCVFDFTHVEDVAAGVITAVGCLAQGQRLPTLHLASGIGTTLGELAGLAAAASRRPLEVTTGPARDFDVDRFVGDPDLARRILGWTCGISLRDGFDRLVAEFAEMQAGEVAGGPST